MKSHQRLICALVLTACAFCVPASAAVRVGVDTFRNGASNIAPGVAQSLTEMFITEMAKSGAFQVFERTQLEAVAKEQRLSMSGLVSDQTLVKVGRLAGIEWIITGAVTQFTESTTAAAIPIKGLTIAMGSEVGAVTLDIRAIDTSTGAITAAIRQEGHAERTLGAVEHRGTVIGAGKHGGVGAEAAMKAVKKVVRELERSIGGVEYHVIKTQGKDVLIDIGSTNGASEGDLYAAYAEGEPIRDYKGNILDVEKEYYALLKIVEVNPRYSRCVYVPEKGKPGAVRTGDPLEPIEHGAQARGLQITKRPMPKMPPMDRPVGGPGHAGPRQPSAGKDSPIFRPAPGVDINNCTDAKLITAYNIPDGKRKNLNILYKNGTKFYMDGNYKQAYDMFLRATDSDFDVLNTYWAGMSALRLGDKANAKKWFEKTLQMHPGYIPAQNALKKIK